METTEKVYKFLCYLKQAYRTEVQLSLSTICKINEIPGEYGKWIVEDGLLIKSSSSKYKWNPEKEPTEEIAEAFRIRYLDIRKSQMKGMVKRRVSEKEELMRVLYEVHGMLKVLIDEMPVKN